MNRLAITDVSQSGGGMTDPDQPARPRRASRALASGLVLACALALAAGCASRKPATTPPTTTETATATAELRALAAKYLVIAQPANHRLDREFDGLNDSERDNLAAAQADLRAAAATERDFDKNVLTIAFPPSIEPVARLLYHVNQARAALTSAAAGSTSLRQLRGDQARLDAANAPVEDAVRVLRDQLGLPPPLAFGYGSGLAEVCRGVLGIR